MSKAEEFIKNHTNNQANISIKISNGEIQSNCIPWVTSEQARKAVEIAREEIYEWLQKVSFDDYKVADEESYRMGCPYDYIDVHRIIKNLKQAMKDE